ncbi:MAG: L-2-hydroxyglutarate oxidase [Opitutales bacterium]
MHTTDVTIIGGGIVGLSTAYELSKRLPKLKITVLEKEKGPAFHQTGHNSGVLHTGIYYKPGSLKAINCREGKKAMERFCAEEGINYEICGKVIVALEEKELPILENIYKRGQANGVTCKMIGKEELLEREPHTAGIKAILVPEAGIVDYKQVCVRMAERIEENHNDQIFYGARVLSMRPENDRMVIETTTGEVETRFVVNCAGLHSDRVTALSGQKPEVKIVPFRGEYFELEASAQRLCRHLIYPVPDPSFPFLGVHFTRMIDGSVECGPNAVLAFSREGYGKMDIRPGDLFESLTYPGFLKLATKYWRVGAGEMWRSVSKAAFVRALQRLVPEITANDLKSAPAGVRAQAISRDGTMVDDFMIQESKQVVNVCNAPSPAATASLNIGKLIVDKLVTHF